MSQPTYQRKRKMDSFSSPLWDRGRVPTRVGLRRAEEIGSNRRAQGYAHRLSTEGCSLTNKRAAGARISLMRLSHGSRRQVGEETGEPLRPASPRWMQSGGH